MTQEEEKRVFMVYAMTRLFGLALFLLGVAIAFTDLIRPGGWPLLGGVMAIFGVLDAVVAPQLIRKAMEKQIDQKK